jgi:hypothetical protein
MKKIWLAKFKKQIKLIFLYFQIVFILILKINFKNLKILFSHIKIKHFKQLTTSVFQNITFMIWFLTFTDSSTTRKAVEKG